MSKSIFFVIAFAFPVVAAANSSSGAVVEYVFSLADIKKRMISSVEAQNHSDHRARDFLLRAVDSFDIASFVRDEAPLIEEMLPASSVQSCISFVGTPLARDFSSTLRTSGSVQAAVSEMGGLPESQQQELASFFESPCLKRTLEVINSPEFQAAIREYGMTLACSSIRSENLSASETARVDADCGRVRR